MKSRTKRRSRTGTIVFYSIYFVLLAAVLSAAAVGLGQLWQFLSHYEASQIYHVTDAVEKQLNSGDRSLLYAAADPDISPYEDEEMLRRQIDERFPGDFSLRKNLRKSTKDVPVYTVMCGEDAVAFLTMKQSGKDALYDLALYSPDSVTGIVPVKNERVTLSYPTGATPFINGTALLPDEAISAEPIAEAEEFGEYLAEIPEMYSCTVDGLMFPPQVEFRDGSGNTLDAVQTGDSYSCPCPGASGEFADDAAEFAMEFSQMYSRYIANDAYFSSLSGYVPADTKLYHDLQTYEGQFYTYHTGYDFTEEKTLRVTQYSESCFAVRVSYVHNVYYGETYSYPADNTVFAVKTADGWRAVGLTMN